MLWIFILVAQILGEVLYVPKGNSKAVECSFEGFQNQLLRVANKENILFVKLKNKTTSQITDLKNQWRLLNPERFVENYLYDLTELLSILFSKSTR